MLKGAVGAKEGGFVTGDRFKFRELVVPGKETVRVCCPPEDPTEQVRTAEVWSVQTGVEPRVMVDGKVKITVELASQDLLCCRKRLYWVVAELVVSFAVSSKSRKGPAVKDSVSVVLEYSTRNWSEE